MSFALWLAECCLAKRRAVAEQTLAPLAVAVARWTLLAKRAVTTLDRRILLQKLRRRRPRGE